MGAIFAPTRTTKHKKQEEDGLEMKICRYLRSEYPDVIFYTDFASDLELTDNQRRRMIAQRSHNGKLPDLTILHPSRGYHGLVIEIKKEGTAVYKKDGVTLRKAPYTRRYKNGSIKRGDHLQEQAEMLQRYNARGYCGRFGIGYQKIIDLIDGYMDRKQRLPF